jgi:hypothetical protein
MSITIRGDNQLIELEPERSYSVRDGWRTVRRWRGTKEAVQLFIPSLLIDGTNIRIIPDEGPTAIIEGWFDNAQDGSAVTDAAQIQTTWSIVNNAFEQSILETAEFEALMFADQGAIRQFNAGNITYSEAVADITADGLKFVNAINAGKVGLEVSSICLRRTKVVSGFDSVTAYLSNANKVYSRAQLISAFNPPAGVQSEMPADGEWLARNGTKEQQSNGKWVITLEWWHLAEWSWLYERVA